MRFYPAEWLSYTATAVVIVALLATVVIIQVRRNRRRRRRRSPWITRAEAFGSIAAVVVLVAIVTHLR